MTKQLFIDYEFRNLVGPKRDLVCVSYKVGLEGETKSVWLEGSKENQHAHALKMRDYAKDHTFIAYTEAEAYCLLQLWDEFDCPPEHFEQYDLYLEYRMLTNYNYALAYGPQLIGDKVVTTTPPRNKWKIKSEEEEDKEKHHKPRHSLAAATYKLLGVTRDTKHKNEMRDLIISGKELSPEDKEAITLYCEDDVKDLPKIYLAVCQHLYDLSPTKDIKLLRKEMLLRGDYSIRTARMSMLGYPIDEPKLRKFSAATKEIIKEAQESINRDYPDVAPFQWNKKSQTYRQKRDKISKWIDDNHPDWPRTDTGQYELRLETVRNYYRSQSKGFGGAFNRYLYLKQSLNGFMPRSENAKTPSFWEALGDDGRIHPSFGIYGSSTARSQPRAYSYLLLKSNWMRSFLLARQGRAIVTIDYGSQEFLISALLSQDSNMISAYESGDPYLYFGKLDGGIPKDGTKETHGEERNVYKTIVLGMSYLMGPSGLRKKLENDLDRSYTEEQAEELINSFREAFPDFSEWQSDYIEDYFDAGSSKLKLPCGWYLYGDVPRFKFRTVGNHAIQGTGSSILRKAVSIAQDKGLDVILTLHDALYVEYDSFDFNAIDLLRESMDEAFRFYFKGRMRERATCRMDAFTWSRDYEKGERETPRGFSFETSNIYLDRKGAKEYSQFIKYFT